MMNAEQWEKMWRTLATMDINHNDPVQPILINARLNRYRRRLILPDQVNEKNHITVIQRMTPYENR